MIKNYVSNLARPMGIQSLEVSLVDGRRLCCRDMHLLSITVDGVLSTALVHLSDIDDMLRGDYCVRLELTVLKALSQMQLSQGQR